MLELNWIELNDRQTASHQCEFNDAHSIFMSDSWQLNGFSPMWILGSPIKYLWTQNFLSQTWQANGFSPVWIQWCTFNFHVTLVTVEWLIANVNSRKPNQIPIKYLKLLVTNMTGKRLLTSVNSMMHIQFSCHTRDSWMAFRQCEF